MRSLVFLGGTALATALDGVHHCNESAIDWSCYTVSNEPGEPTTVAGLATKLHVAPTKLMDYNLLGSDPSVQVAVGTPLRVPHDACTPRTGSWNCYTVQGGETLYDVASSSASLIRNETLILEYNEDVLYGNTNGPLPAGLQLRLPTTPCLPTLDTMCYRVGGDTYSPITGQTLADVATIFGTTADALADLNEGTLGGNTTVVDGMQLIVPRPNAKAPSPCVKSRDWDCYTVQSEDTLAKIALKMSAADHYSTPEPRANWIYLCEVNGLEDCDKLEIGQVLAIPLRASDSKTGFHSDCVDEAGVWYCRTVPAPPAGCYNAPPTACALAAEQTAETLSPFGGVGGNTYITGKSAALQMISFNQDLLPRNQSEENIFFVPGSTVRVPYNIIDCFPTVERDCVAVGDAHLARYHDAAYFAPMSLYSFRTNGLRGYLGNCQSGQQVPADCSEHTVLEVPRQTLPIAACQEPGRVNATEPSCNSGPGGAPYECPTCEIVPGKHFCYKVAYGETLYSISALFGLSYQTLCFYNDMTNCDCLYAEDTYLKIPTHAPSIGHK